jgi:hypothetical protein
VVAHGGHRVCIGTLAWRHCQKHALCAPDLTRTALAFVMDGRHLLTERSASGTLEGEQAL